MIKDPESAEVTKNRKTKIVASRLEIPESGKCFKNSNKATEESFSTAATKLSWFSNRMLNSAAFPINPIQTNVNPVGISNTPTINSRMVRPRETRAINIPTKGDQEIHHAQYMMVQPPIQPVG